MNTKYGLVYVVTVGDQDFEFQNLQAAKAWAFEKLGDPHLYRKVRRPV